MPHLLFFISLAPHHGNHSFQFHADAPSASWLQPTLNPTRPLDLYPRRVTLPCIPEGRRCSETTHRALHRRPCRPMSDGRRASAAPAPTTAAAQIEEEVAFSLGGGWFALTHQLLKCKTMVEIELRDDYLCSEGLKCKTARRTYESTVVLQFY
jgi:hypothetical protein